METQQRSVGYKNILLKGVLSLETLEEVTNTETPNAPDSKEKVRDNIIGQVNTILGDFYNVKTKEKSDFNGKKWIDDNLKDKFSNKFGADGKLGKDFDLSSLREKRTLKLVLQDVSNQAREGLRAISPAKVKAEKKAEEQTKLLNRRLDYLGVLEGINELLQYMDEENGGKDEKRLDRKVSRELSDDVIFSQPDPTKTLLDTRANIEAEKKAVPGATEAIQKEQQRVQLEAKKNAGIKAIEAKFTETEIVGSIIPNAAADIFTANLKLKGPGGIDAPVLPFTGVQFDGGGVLINPAKEYAIGGKNYKLNLNGNTGKYNVVDGTTITNNTASIQKEVVINGPTNTVTPKLSANGEAVQKFDIKNQAKNKNFISGADQPLNPKERADVSKNPVLALQKSYIEIAKLPEYKDLFNVKVGKHIDGKSDGFDDGQMGPWTRAVTANFQKLYYENTMKTTPNSVIATKFKQENFGKSTKAWDGLVGTSTQKAINTVRAITPIPDANNPAGNIIIDDDDKNVGNVLPNALGNDVYEDLDYSTVQADLKERVTKLNGSDLSAFDTLDGSKLLLAVANTDTYKTKVDLGTDGKVTSGNGIGYVIQDGNDPAIQFGDFKKGGQWLITYFPDKEINISKQGESDFFTINTDNKVTFMEGEA